MQEKVKANLLAQAEAKLDRKRLRLVGRKSLRPREPALARKVKKEQLLNQSLQSPQKSLPQSASVVPRIVKITSLPLRKKCAPKAARKLSATKDSVLIETVKSFKSTYER